MTRKSSASTCVLFLLVFLTGCAEVPPPRDSISVSPSPAFVGSSQSIQFTATLNGHNSGVTWAVNGVAGGNSMTGTIDANGNFTAPSVTQNATATVTAMSKSDASKSASANIAIVAPGTVAQTNNPQVALYTITPPADANVSIQFGPDTSYGLTTWTQPAPSGGGAVSIFVAGMRANTPYHMRAVVQFSANATVNDSDHTFTTGALPAANLPQITASTTAGMTPQGGVELLSLTATSTRMTAAVTDLSGNILWGYDIGLGAGSLAFPFKLLPNGHFLLNDAFGAAPDGTGSVMREIDLGGNVVWQMTAADLNNALAAATCSGCNITVFGMHHDFAILPNGHMIVLAGQQKTISGLTGYTTPQTVYGDVVIDLDQNHKPVWLWSTFDHLDPNRHPFGLPDWIHMNSVTYSPDDGDLIVSSRHQSWVMKIDYHDGSGTGDVLWKLGYQGDLALQGGTDPVDWQYAQHDANVVSTNSSGVFQLTLFDDGNNRVLDSSGDVCGTTGQPACYTRIPVYQIDETAKTATLEWVDDLSPYFSFWGGSSRLLPNGNVEFDECADGANSAIYEVTRTTPPQTVWQMHVTGQNAYRGYRIGSLYPGVQW